MTATHSYAQLQTNNELSCPPVFTHVILSVWNAFDPWETSGLPLASSWNAICDNFPTLSFLQVEQITPREASSAEQIFFCTTSHTGAVIYAGGQVPRWPRLHLCILALLTMPSTVQSHSKHTVGAQ